MALEVRRTWTSLLGLVVVLAAAGTVSAATFEVSSQQTRGMGSDGKLLRGSFTVPSGGATITQCSGPQAGFWITYPNGSVKTFATCNQAIGLALPAGQGYSAYPNLARDQVSAALNLTLATAGDCSLTGSWAAVTPEGTMTFNLTQAGQRLTGTLKFTSTEGSIDGPIKGLVNGTNVRFEGEDADMSMTGVVAANCGSVQLTMTSDGETHAVTMKRQ